MYASQTLLGADAKAAVDDSWMRSTWAALGLDAEASVLAVFLEALRPDPNWWPLKSKYSMSLG